MQIVLRFFNGDQQPQEIRDGAPPGRLDWRDPPREGETEGQAREFWLDSKVWAEKGRAVYREVTCGEGT